ncbi:hypothetical protein [Streptomonospora arabica]|uniref:Uncharacterized protein n=1 Tax=Streptomonospora arabica TaxID=412417 RepID=A0ABV9SL36_9ACTN
MIEVPDVGGGICALAVAFMFLYRAGGSRVQGWGRGSWMALSILCILVGLLFLFWISLFPDSFGSGVNSVDAVIGLFGGVVGPIGSGVTILVGLRADSYKE